MADTGSRSRRLRNGRFRPREAWSQRYASPSGRQRWRHHSAEATAAGPSTGHRRKRSRAPGREGGPRSGIASGRRKPYGSSKASRNSRSRERGRKRSGKRCGFSLRALQRCNAQTRRRCEAWWREHYRNRRKFLFSTAWERRTARGSRTYFRFIPAAREAPLRK